MENMSVELEYTIQSSDILDGTIDFIDTVAPDDSASSFSSKVESYVNNHLNQSVIAFTDGAVAESSRGSCAVILIPLEPEKSVDRTSKVHNMLTCSLEVEIAAIALAMELAAHYYSFTTMKKEHEKLFILSDSKSAFNCIRQRSAMRHFHSILSQISSAIHILQGLGVKAAISWIPSHSGIYWNEQVDEMAKAALQQVPEVRNNVITFAACKYIISKQITCTWQRRWDRSPTTRTTYEYVPSVCKRTMFPERRCTALSYSRLLLNDSSLRIHQHHAGLVDTKECECG